MWDEILRSAATDGLWALMFAALLIFILKDGKRREEKYQDTVRRLSQSLNVVLDIRDDIKNLCATLSNLKCAAQPKCPADCKKPQNAAKAKKVDADIDAKSGEKPKPPLKIKEVVLDELQNQT